MVKHKEKWNCLSCTTTPIGWRVISLKSKSKAEKKERETQLYDHLTTTLHSWVCPLRHSLWDFPELLCEERKRQFWDKSKQAPHVGSLLLSLNFVSYFLWSFCCLPLVLTLTLKPLSLEKQSTLASPTQFTLANLVFSMWESESEAAAGRREYGGGILNSSKHGVKIEGFQQRGNSW